MDEQHENGWDDLFGNDDEPDNTGSGDSFPSWINRDSIVFLIDAQLPMFQSNSDGEVPFYNAVNCAVSTLTDKVIASDSDLVGVCFYGTREKNNTNDFENIFVFQELDAQKILDLENLLKVDFSSVYGHYPEDSKQVFSLSDALWTCSTLFSSCNSKVGHKRIFLFTNEDNPNGPSQLPSHSNLTNKALHRAKDLALLGIEIELFAMNKIDQTFDPSKFYVELIDMNDGIVGDQDNNQLNGISARFSAASKFEELQQRVRRKEFKKRAQGALTFIIPVGPGTRDSEGVLTHQESVEFGVSIFNINQDTKKGAALPLESKTNKPLKRIRKYICEDTASVLMSHQVLQGFMFGDETVVFDGQEISQRIKNCCFKKSGITLLGFKHRDKALKNYYNIKHSSFLYPNEGFIYGSTLAFNSLYQTMIKLQQVAIVLITPRANSTPRMAALEPQIEVVDEDGVQTFPPGFNVVWLPYSGDIRTNVPYPSSNPVPKLQEQQTTLPGKASTEDIVLAKNLVKKLRIKFNSANFENPSLQKHYANLQALALDRDAEEEIVDYVQPDEEGMQKFSHLMQQFKQELFPENYDPQPKKTPGKKRAREDDDMGDDPSGPPKKRQKTSNSVSIDGIDWKALAEAGTLGSLSMAHLKAYCIQNGVSGYSKFKKAELVDFVSNHISGT